MSVKIYVKYYGNDGEVSHQYKEIWSKTDLFCPSCGKTEVWAEDGPGDYYVGEDYLCMGCGAQFNLPSGCGSVYPNKPNSKWDQVISGIRSENKGSK